jgi:hypothetical protein
VFPINPGLNGSFPWLSNIAQNWESYKFHKLRYCYYTRTGSTTVGSVILAPDYDATDGPPINEQVIASYEDAVEDAPWKDLVCTLKERSMFSIGPKKFVRSADVGFNDLKLYDAGNLYIATVDSTAAAAWGKLWVEYDITFFTPQIAPVGTLLDDSNFGQFPSNSLTASKFFATANFGLQYPGGSLGCRAGGDRIIDLVGCIVNAEYLFYFSIIGTNITTVLTAALGGATIKTALFSIVGENNDLAVISGTFIANSIGVQLVFGTVTAATVVSSTFAITAVNANNGY